jgi:hypothetical protein
MTFPGLVKANNLSDIGDKEKAWNNLGNRININLLSIDPKYPDVSLLLHGDALNGSTTIIDNSPSPKIATIFGSAQISTVQSKFGGASLVGGSSPNFTWGVNRIQFSPGPDFAYGTGDFTFEYWTFPTVGNIDRIAYSQAVNGINYFTTGILSDNLAFLFFGVSGGGRAVLGPAVPVNTWSHVAVVRLNGVARVYVNGVSGSPVNCDQDFSNTTYPVNIGGYSHQPGTWPYNGYIDDLRITKGIARYTANFTPPTLPFYDPINTFITSTANGRDILALNQVRNTSPRDFIFIKGLSSSVQSRLNVATQSAASGATLSNAFLLKQSPSSVGAYSILNGTLNAQQLKINGVQASSLSSSPFFGSTALFPLSITTMELCDNFRFVPLFSSGTVVSPTIGMPVETSEFFLYAKTGQS